MFKLIHKHWLYRWERFYSRNRWHLILDISLLVILIIFASLAISLQFYRPNIDFNNIYNPLAVYKPIDLNNQPLDLTAALETASQNIEEGIILKLNFKNKANYPINNLKFNFTVLTKNFSIDRLELIAKDNPDISINGTDIILANLPAKLSKDLNLKVYFKNKNNADKKINWQINSNYLVGIQNLNKIFDLPIIQLASKLNVDSRAYYNSPQGDQLGAGPLPPIVSLPTNYWIFLQANSDGDFNNFIYSAKLPHGVELTGNRSILFGDFNYNKDSRQIIWRIPAIKANVKDYRAGFEVQLIPTIEQVNKVLPFLTSARYSAQEDGEIKNDINRVISSPDTNLEFDLINKGQGKVVE